MFDKKTTFSTLFVLSILFALPLAATADHRERLVGTWQCLQDTGDLRLVTFNKGDDQLAG